MEQRVRAAHKDGFRNSKILKYGSRNLNFQPEMDSFLISQKKLKKLLIFVFAALDL